MTLLQRSEESQLTNDIWVYAEHTPEKLHNVTSEVLGAARSLADHTGGEVCAVIIGNGVERIRSTSWMMKSTGITTTNFYQGSGEAGQAASSEDFPVRFGL